MAEKEKRAQTAKNSPLLDDEGFAGEGKLGKDMQFINRVRAKESTHLPLVMSVEEIKVLLPEACDSAHIATLVCNSYA